MPRKPPPETPLYVRLPNSAVEKLDRAAEQLGMRKKDLVAGLVTRYVEPYMASKGRPLDTDEGGPMVGTYSFQPYDPPEIMNAAQAGQFLQIDEKMVVELAEAGKLPGRKLGPAWRFSREALVAWLSAPEKR